MTGVGTPGADADELAQFQLAAAYREIRDALSAIKKTRERLKNFWVDGLRDTHAKLSEVSSTTETAAMELMDGLDRTLALIDTLESGDAHDGAHRFAQLRDEVNQLYGHLQFQDIIAQQLRGVGAVLGDVEDHLARVATLLDEGTDDTATATHAVDPHAFNADASMSAVTERQALIDEAFLAARTRS